MPKLIIKPFSVNGAWKGQKFKTDKYKSYEKLLLFTLPDVFIPDGPLLVVFEFGFNSDLSDADNPVKPLLDILQKKYRFNDSRVYQVASTKVLIPREKDEYISFEIYSYCEFQMKLIDMKFVNMYSN